MNQISPKTWHVVYLVDLEEPLMNLLTVIADYTDNESVFSPTDVLMMAINMLTVSHCVDEAIEAMEIDINNFCRFVATPYNNKRIKSAIHRYMHGMHNEFQRLNFYGRDAHLQYTFGGWHGDYTPRFIPNTHVEQYKDAIPGIVSSESSQLHPRFVHQPYNQEKDMLEVERKLMEA